MRHVLISENCDQPNGMYLVKDSVWWEDNDIIPVQLQTDGFDQWPIIGSAMDIRREKDDITADIIADIPKGGIFSVLLLNAIKHDFKGTTFITDGKLISAVVVPPPEPEKKRSSNE